jgi:hypothetical protein
MRTDWHKHQTDAYKCTTPCAASYKLHQQHMRPTLQIQGARQEATQPFPFLTQLAHGEERAKTSTFPQRLHGCNACGRQSCDVAVHCLQVLLFACHLEYLYTQTVSQHLNIRSCCDLVHLRHG